MNSSVLSLTLCNILFAMFFFFFFFYFIVLINFLREQQFPAEVIRDLELVGDFATASTSEILSAKLANMRLKYGRNPLDTGSAEVQVAMLTERLKGYDRHMITHKADIATRRGFLA